MTANNPSDPAETVLEFDGVSKWYGPVIGLNQVSLTLKGGITGLVGSNGAGKSTLLRLATGQLKPSLGRVLVRGSDAWTWQAKALVGYCPDNDAFYEDMTGRDFVRAMARLCGFTRADANRRTEEVLGKPAHETALGEAGRGFDHFQTAMDSARLVLPSAAGCEELFKRECAGADFLVIPAEAADFGEGAKKCGGEDAAGAETGAFRRGSEEGDFESAAEFAEEGFE